MMGKVDDPFAILGLDPDASPDEIADAYRRLAKRWHPDRGGGPEAELRMARINVAHDLLRAQARHATRRTGSASQSPAARRRTVGGAQGATPPLRAAVACVRRLAWRA